MMRVVVILFTLLAMFMTLTDGLELVHNGGFESSTDGWWCLGCQMTLTSDKYSGHSALKVTNRLHSSSVPEQLVNVTVGRSYNVSCYVKLIKNGGFGELVQISVVSYYGSHIQHFKTAARHDLTTVADGWIHLMGTFTVDTDHTGATLVKTKLYVTTTNASVDFIVDDVSLTELPQDPAWRAHTDAVISQIRKADINFRVTTAPGVDKGAVEIQVLQTKKSFPFGTGVNAKFYNGLQSSQATASYRRFVHRHFNWASPMTSLTWQEIEPQQGHVDMTQALAMIHALRNHGLLIRGDSLITASPYYVQDWLKALSGGQLRHKVTEHVQKTMQQTAGLLEQWDVVSEIFNGDWLQEGMQDANYLEEIFRTAHAADPYVQLFLNDFNVVGFGSNTVEYTELAKRLKRADVGLNGLGAQGSFLVEEDPDPELIKERLDVLATAGLPIWATKVKLWAKDNRKRADAYEHALRSLYGHPAVEGIVLWGFWDGEVNAQSTALTTGDDMQLTEAGRRVLDLLENQWMTDETHVLSHSGDNFRVRGFHGDYEVHVRYHGHEVLNLKQSFSLGKGGHTVTINVHV